MKAIDVLKIINESFLNCDYPIQYVILSPRDSMKYTVGDLIKDTIKEGSIEQQNEE